MCGNRAQDKQVGGILDFANLWGGEVKITWGEGSFGSGLAQGEVKGLVHGFPN